MVILFQHLPKGESSGFCYDSLRLFLATT